jgi:nitrate reductase NapAB chaperone NapD
MNIVGMQVYIRPGCAESIARQIDALPGAQVYSASPESHSLSIELRQADDALLGEAMVRIQQMEGVLKTAILFERYSEHLGK